MGTINNAIKTARIYKQNDDFSYLFIGCKNMTSVDLSSMDKSTPLEKIEGMFSGCSSLTSIDFSSLDIDNVTDIDYLFNDCSSVTNINLSNWDTSKITSSENTFKGFPTSGVNWNYTPESYSGFDLLEIKVAYDGIFPWNEAYMELFACDPEDSWRTVLNSVVPDFDNINYDFNVKEEEIVNIIVDAYMNDGAIRKNISWDTDVYLSEGVNKVIVKYNKNNIETFRFSGRAGLKSVEHLEITDKFTHLEEFFSGCYNLQTVNTSGWDTSNVTSLYNIFYNCYDLASVDFSNLDFSKIYNYNYAFYRCNSLVSIKMPENLNCPSDQVIRFNNTFRECYALVDIENLSTWKNVRFDTVNRCFYECNSLKRLDLRNFIPAYTNNSFSYAFYNCTSLEYLNISTWASNYSYESYTFNGMSILTAEQWGYDGTNYSGFLLTETQTHYNGIFPWNGKEIANYTYKPSYGNAMPQFENFSESDYSIKTYSNSDGTSTRVIYTNTGNGKLPTTIKFNNYTCNSSILKINYVNTSNLTSFENMFQGCSELQEVRASNWDTSKVTNLKSMFQDCGKLKAVYAENWDTSKVVDINLLFFGCNNLEVLHLENWNTGAVSQSGNLTVFTGVPCIKDWGYDGNNYNNWTLTEYQTSYEYVFPWSNYNELLQYTFMTGIDATPTFNSGFEYRKNEIDNGDGTTTRTIYSESYFNSIDFTSRNSLLRIDNLYLTSLSSIPLFSSCVALEYIRFSGNLMLAEHISYDQIFANCIELKRIDGMEGFRVIKPYALNGVFYNCNKLESLDLSHWIVDNSLNSTDAMFCNCSSLKKLNLSTWYADKNLTSTTTYGSYFQDVPTNVNWCYDGTNYTNWKVSELDSNYAATFPWNMSAYIEYTVRQDTQYPLNANATSAAEGVININMPRFYFKDKYGFEQTFGKIEITKTDGTKTDLLSTTTNNISKVRIYYNKDKYNAIRFGTMDAGSSLITSVTHLEGGNLTDITGMFANCTFLHTVDMSSVNTANMTNISNVFYNCNSLKNINISNWIIGSNVNVTGSFYNLPTSDLSGWRYSGINFIPTASQCGFGTKFPWQN